MTRRPFFTIDSHVFADLLFNHGEPLTIARAHVQQLLQAFAPEQIVIGRRLDARERVLFASLRDDSDAEAFARMFPDRRGRWGKRRLRTRR